MNNIAFNDDLQMLKAQMQVLRRHLSDDEIVSREMLEATFRTSVKSLTASRRQCLIGIAVDVIVSAYFVWLYFTRTGFSLAITVSTVVWGAFWALYNWRVWRLDLRRSLLATPLVQAARSVARWRRENLRQGIACGVATAAWLAVLVAETGGQLVGNPSAMVVPLVMVVMVVAFVAGRYRRIHTATSRLLAQINELEQ